MENEEMRPTPEMPLSCEVCLKEIPESTAYNPEGADYVGAFCGLECYQVFVARHRAEAERAEQARREQERKIVTGEGIADERAEHRRH